MKVWRRSEPRTARPFFALSALDESLDDTVLLVGEREKEIEEDIVQIDPADFDGLHVAICPKLDLEKIRSTLGERADGVVLLLSLRDPMFKRRLIYRQWPVTRDLPERISLTPPRSWSSVTSASCTRLSLSRSSPTPRRRPVGRIARAPGSPSAPSS